MPKGNREEPIAVITDASEGIIPSRKRSQKAKDTACLLNCNNNLTMRAALNVRDAE